MYLKGSKYSYNGRRRRSSPIRVLILAILAAAGLYFSIVIVPETQPLFIPTSTPTTPPESYINEGAQFEAEGKTSRAIESYQKAIDADPKNSSTYISLAKLQMFNGSYEDALKNAENAILLNGNNAVAHAIRGWALGSEGDYLDADTAFNRAYEIDPTQPLTYAYNAEVLVDQINAGEDKLDTLDKAVQYSRQAVEYGNNLMEAHRARGLVYEITGNYAEAVQEFQIAITSNPNIADLYLALGRSYRANGQDSDAITAFERARSLNPYDPWAPYYISRTYGGNGEYAKAIQAAQDSIDLDPTEAQFYWNLGTQYYRYEKFADSLKNLGIAINGGTTDDGKKIDPIPLSYDNRVSELYYMYGVILARSGQCQEAAKIVQQLVSTVPDDQTAMLNADFMTETCKNAAFDITLNTAESTQEGTTGNPDTNTNPGATENGQQPPSPAETQIPPDNNSVPPTENPSLNPQNDQQPAAAPPQ